MYISKPCSVDVNTLQLLSPASRVYFLPSSGLSRAASTAEMMSYSAASPSAVAPSSSDSESSPATSGNEGTERCRKLPVSSYSCGPLRVGLLRPEPLTLPVHLRVGAEALLHPPELLDAVLAFRLLLGVDEAAEGGLELLSAHAVGHASETWAVPVDLPRLWVEGGLGRVFLVFVRWSGRRRR